MKRLIYATTMPMNLAEEFTARFCDFFGIDADKVTLDAIEPESGNHQFLVKFNNGMRLKEISLRFYYTSNTKTKVKSEQGWFTGRWILYIPVTGDESIIDKAIAELDRKVSFHKYLVPDKIVVWPSPQFWRSLRAGSEKFDDAWGKWLASAEKEVNDSLNLFCEPSVQGSEGSMFIYDTSGQGYQEITTVDFYDWCEAEKTLAAKSKSSDEFKEKYKEFIIETISN